MKYPCNMIRDLLPLYHDGVCSQESEAAVKEHLAACTACAAYYAEMGRAASPAPLPQDPAAETRKAASFRALRRRLWKKQVLAVLLAVVLCAALLLAGIGYLRHAERVIPYGDNITVSVQDGSLVGRLQGDQANRLHVKRVETNVDGQTQTYLFFCLSGTKWDAMVTGEAVVSEYVLCAADKGAAQVDGVFYYTGDDTGIENLSPEALQQVMDSAVLLWQS